MESLKDPERGRDMKEGCATAEEEEEDDEEAVSDIGSETMLDQQSQWSGKGRFGVKGAEQKMEDDSIFHMEGGGEGECQKNVYT